MPKASNQEIAGIFYKIADILEMQDVQWKPRAYRAAANTIEGMEKQVSEIYKEGGLKALDGIPAVGEHLAKKIEELVKTGKLRYFEELKKELPIDFDLFDSVPGLGPKKLMALHEKLGIRNKSDLRKAAEQHKIKGLPGFAEKSEQEILDSLLREDGKGERIPLAVAKPIAKDIVERLRSLKESIKVEAAGSLRRKRPSVGDIDILAASWKPEKLSEIFVSMPLVKKVLAKGKTKSSVILKTGLQVDLRVVNMSQWGSALLYFTGSKAHNIALRRIAIKKGLKLSEYGLFKGVKVVASKTEKEVYEALGISYIKPELRENEGEVEKAMKSFSKGK